jgi:hypothetical protein
MIDIIDAMNNRTDKTSSLLDGTPLHETAPVSMVECMAHQSCVSVADYNGGRSNCSAGRRAFSQVCLC